MLSIPYGVDFREFAKGPVFLSLRGQELLHIVSQDNLLLSSEVHLFTAILRWIEHSPDRWMWAVPLLRQVRYHLMPIDYVEEVVKHKTLMRFSGAGELLIESRLLQIKYQLSLQSGGDDTWASKGCPRRSAYTSHALFVFGENQGVISHVDKYDLPKQVWTRLDADIPLTRSGIITYRGSIWFVGGKNLFSGSLRCVFSLGPTKWQAEQVMEQARHNHGVAELEGILFAVGGEDTETGILNSLEIYAKHGRSGNWGWTRGADMIKRRTGHGVDATGMRVFVVGGVDESNARIALIECYHIRSKQWSVLQRYGRERTECFAVTFQGWLFLLGGDDLGVVDCITCTGIQVYVTTLPKNDQVIAVAVHNGDMYVQLCDENRRTSFHSFNPAHRWASEFPQPLDAIQLDGARSVFYNGTIKTFNFPPELCSESESDSNSEEFLDTLEVASAGCGTPLRNPSKYGLPSSATDDVLEASTVFEQKSPSLDVGLLDQLVCYLKAPESVPCPHLLKPLQIQRKNNVLSSAPGDVLQPSTILEQTSASLDELGRILFDLNLTGTPSVPAGCCKRLRSPDDVFEKPTVSEQSIGSCNVSDHPLLDSTGPLSVSTAGYYKPLPSSSKNSVSSSAPCAILEPPTVFEQTSGPYDTIDGTERPSVPPAGYFKPLRTSSKNSVSSSAPGDVFEKSATSGQSVGSCDVSNHPSLDIIAPPSVPAAGYYQVLRSPRTKSVSSSAPSDIPEPSTVIERTSASCDVVDYLSLADTRHRSSFASADIAGPSPIFRHDEPILRSLLENRQDANRTHMPRCHTLPANIHRTSVASGENSRFQGLDELIRGANRNRGSISHYNPVLGDLVEPRHGANRTYMPRCHTPLDIHRTSAVFGENSGFRGVCEPNRRGISHSAPTYVTRPSVAYIYNHPTVQWGRFGMPVNSSQPSPFSYTSMARFFPPIKGEGGGYPSSPTAEEMHHLDPNDPIDAAIISYSKSGMNGAAAICARLLKFSNDRRRRRVTPYSRLRSERVQRRGPTASPADNVAHFIYHDETGELSVPSSIASSETNPTRPTP